MLCAVHLASKLQPSPGSRVSHRLDFCMVCILSLATIGWTDTMAVSPASLANAVVMEMVLTFFTQRGKSISTWNFADVVHRLHLATVTAW